MSKRIAVLIFAFILLPARLLTAQETYDIGPVIITAERIPIPESKITPNVSVITSEDIEASGAQTLGELLQSYPGITYQQSGSLGKLNDIRVRGSATAQLLYLVDGVEINDMSNATVNFAQLSLDDIDRIEVVRGGVSALYGSKGMNGVIQIFKKKPSGKNSARLKTSYGSFDTYDSSLSYEGKTRSGGYRFFVDSAQSNGVRENDDFKRIAWNSDFTTAAGAHRFDFNMQGSGMENGLSLGWGGVPDSDDRQNDRNILGSLSWIWKPGNDRQLSAKIYNKTGTLSYRAPGASMTDFGLTKSRVRGFETQFNKRFNRVDAVFGFAYEKIHGDRQNYVWDPLTWLASPASSPGNWHTSALFINTVTTLNGGFSLSAGARYDDYSNFGNQLNPKFTLTKTFNKKATAYFSVGKNFRAPTFNDLYYPGYGNTNLLPESSSYKELGVKYFVSPQLRFSLTGYNYRYRGLIAAQLVNPVLWIYAPMNIARAKINGAEFETVLSPGSNLEYAFNYTHLDALNLDTRNEVNRAPTDQYNLNISYSGKSRWGWSLNGKLVSSIYDTSVSRPVDGYFICDGKVLYKKSRGVSYFIEGNNILDKNYNMTADYAAPGASVRIGLSKEL